MKRCPKCGCKEFIVTAHVAEVWVMDEYGCFLEVIDDCEYVVHRPDDNDLWMCKNCTFEDAGSVFNVKEDK